MNLLEKVLRCVCVFKVYRNRTGCFTHPRSSLLIASLKIAGFKWHLDRCWIIHSQQSWPSSVERKWLGMRKVEVSLTLIKPADVAKDSKAHFYAWHLFWSQSKLTFQWRTWTVTLNLRNFLSWHSNEVPVTVAMGGKSQAGASTNNISSNFLQSETFNLCINNRSPTFPYRNKS